MLCRLVSCRCYIKVLVKLKAQRNLNTEELCIPLHQKITLVNYLLDSLLQIPLCFSFLNQPSICNYNNKLFYFTNFTGPTKTCPIAIGTNGNHLFIHSFTSFSGHRPAQRECARTGLRSHARCHPYPIPQPVKVGNTTGVCDPYSFRIVMWVLLHPTRTNQ